MEEIAVGVAFAVNLFPAYARMREAPSTAGR
jgi:hypothetical protein